MFSFRKILFITFLKCSKETKFRHNSKCHKIRTWLNDAAITKDIQITFYKRSQCLLAEIWQVAAGRCGSVTR